MTQKTFTALCLLALSTLGVACTENAGDETRSEDSLTAAGVPEGEPIAPPIFITPVVSGEFDLTRALDVPDVGSRTTLDIVGGPSGIGEATFTTRSTTVPVPAGLPEGEPILPPTALGRKYKITAQNTACGKIYSGSAPLGGAVASVTIRDFRDLGPSCPALIASELSAEETINGVTTQWYGRQRPSTVFPPDATRLVAHTAGGGFVPPSPPGSSCTIGAQDYALDVATRRLTWEVCEFADWSTPFKTATGSRVLSQAEFQTVLAAARQVKISNRDVCGADKPFMTISVTRPSGTTLYKDDFYSCFGSGPFVENIDAVFGAFSNVVGHHPG